MSGHSKWHTIKHKKGAADAKRGKVFTRLIKELTVAARSGGGDPNMNPRLRTIIAEAKANNMPRENIERAIRRGTGEEPGVSYEEITYEGYGPGGVALMIQSLTDNKNRTVGEIRHLLSKFNGNLAAENSVAWMFSRKGQVVIEKGKADEEQLLNVALDAGADDMNDDGSAWEIVSSPESFEGVKVELEGRALRRSKGPVRVDDKLDAKVALLTFHPGQTPEEVEAVAHDVHGLVIAGTGLGHVAQELIPVLARVAKDGVVVVMTTQTLQGRVNLRVYDTGRDLLKAGVIGGEDMLPETALVKLMWVLGHTREPAEVAKAMATNVAGEINPTIGLDEFAT